MQRSPHLSVPNPHPQTHLKRTQYTSRSGQRSQETTQTQKGSYIDVQRIFDCLVHSHLPHELPSTMSTKTTFSCGHTATTWSSHCPNPHLPTGTKCPPPSSFPFLCRSCARDEASLEDVNIRADYDPRISDLGQRIQRTKDVLTSDDVESWEEVRRWQKKEYELMLRKERKLIICWREFKERWD